MFAPGIVVYEKGRRWEAALKRYFQTRNVQVRPCRLPAEVMSALNAMPGSLTVVDLAAGAGPALRLISQARQHVPASNVIAIAPDHLADLEWPAREFGAVAFLPETVSETDLGEMCSRQMELLR